jgi:hypothetical protein
MYQQEDLLPTNRNYIFLVGCFSIFFTFIIGSVLISSFTKTKEVNKDQGLSLVTNQTKPQADLTKYNQDSDKDLIPNFIEEEAILNTYLSEVSYCEQSNPICDKNPFDGEFFISIIIDSSTSMNIPAKGNISKIDRVKNELNTLFNKLNKENFIKLQIIGSGNKGNLSFIADNESCVTNYTFKEYNQVLDEKDSNKVILDKLVPNGKSPIGFILEQAEKRFPSKEGNNLVIILTDGLDDCGYNLNNTFRGVLSRGVVKKINVISIYSPQDENQKLKEATESNGGLFSDSEDIFAVLFEWKDQFISSNWCKVKDFSKVTSCLNNNYSKAINLLDEKILSDSPQNELSKIREIKSSIDLLIQNYTKSKNDEFNLQFDNFYKTLVND